MISFVQLFGSIQVFLITFQIANSTKEGCQDFRDIKEAKLAKVLCVARVLVVQET